MAISGSEGSGSLFGSHRRGPRDALCSRGPSVCVFLTRRRGVSCRTENQGRGRCSRPSSPGAASAPCAVSLTTPGHCVPPDRWSILLVACFCIRFSLSFSPPYTPKQECSSLERQVGFHGGRLSRPANPFWEASAVRCGREGLTPVFLGRRSLCALTFRLRSSLLIAHLRLGAV